MVEVTQADREAALKTLNPHGDEVHIHNLNKGYNTPLAQQFARHREAANAEARQMLITQAAETAKAAKYYNERIADLTRERDELAEALQRLLAPFGHDAHLGTPIGPSPDDYDYARAALAKLDAGKVQP
jgi:uncharacterized coiled-coil DUF342 family protein